MGHEKIVMIGAGNLAHHLSAELLKAGEDLCQIYSLTIESARTLGLRTGLPYTSNPQAVVDDADVYIFAVKDDALPAVIRHISFPPDAILLHTCGSQPMKVFANKAKNYGVLYPIQTFSKRREVDFQEVPLCLEGSNRRVIKYLQTLAARLSRHVYMITSEQRRQIHLAAVFVCNFPNYLYTVGSKILEEASLPRELLTPLIVETADRIRTIAPEKVQTGPAVRGDKSIMNAHRKMLRSEPLWAEIYDAISDAIANASTTPVQELAPELPFQEKPTPAKKDEDENTPTLF